MVVWGRRCLPILVVVAVLVSGRGAVSPAVAQAPDTVALEAGCNNITLDYPIGTPVRVVAETVQPIRALTGIFRYDPAMQRFLAFAPNVSDAAIDYPAITAPLEVVYVCMAAPGTIVRSGGGPPAVAVVAQPLPTPAPMVAPTPAPVTQPAAALVTFGVVSAPREVRRGQSVTIVIGTVPGYVCLGGVNIPSFDAAFRFVPIDAVASTSGTAIIRFDTFESDNRGWAYFAVRCGDIQVIRVEIRLT